VAGGWLDAMLEGELVVEWRAVAAYEARRRAGGAAGRSPAVLVDASGVAWHRSRSGLLKQERRDPPGEAAPWLEPGDGTVVEEALR